MDADFAYLPQNPQLFRAVLDFNRFYEAPDFGLTEAGEPAARLAAELAACPRLWRGFGLERESPALWCFEPPENRLALLPFPAILRLAAYWSAVVLADTFARTLDGQRLRRAKEVVGPDVFRYAVRQGRLQLGRLRHAWLPPSAELLSDRILRYPGQKLLRLCMGLWPDDLREVWLTRWRADAQAAKILPAQDRAEENRALWDESWPGIEKLLLTEVAPAWQACFS
jgi:hypothetical protein